jgi:hypothetical protein
MAEEEPKTAAPSEEEEATAGAADTAPNDGTPGGDETEEVKEEESTAQFAPVVSACTHCHCWPASLCTLLSLSLVSYGGVGRYPDGSIPLFMQAGA